MRSRKILLTSTLIILILLLISYGSLYAQPETKLEEQKIKELDKPSRVPTEEELVRELDDILSHGDNIITIEGLDIFMRLFAQYDSARGYNELVQKIMDIPEFESFNAQYSDQAYKFSSLRLRMLTHFRTYPGVHEFVLNSLESPIPHLRVEAAATLLFWSEWDLAMPLICRHEAYNLFQIHKDQRAVPLLKEAVQNAGWQGKILAAAALFYTYGDSTEYPKVALDIILNAPINSDDVNTNRAIFLALDQVARFNLTQALPGLIRLTQDTAPGISPKAVGLMIDLAGMGYSEAITALNDIKVNHSDAKIRELAKSGLQKLERSQK